MKKLIRSINIFILLMAIFTTTGCSTENDTKAQRNLTPEAIAGKDNWQKEFVTELSAKGFLPDEILKSFSDFNEKKDEGNKTLYTWSSWDEEKNDFIHNIQMVADKKKLLSYHYKNYYYKEVKCRIVMANEEAEVMVEEFAKFFLNNGERLSFKKDPKKQVQSLYLPKHVETWTAESIEGTHSIVVDFDMGSIVYYSLEKSV